jgi:hypothetical protein
MQGLHHQPPPPSVTASYNTRYPELHIMKRYPVDSPLLQQDRDLLLFFANEVPHPYCREFEDSDCSSYSKRGQKTLYYVSGGPFPGYFRYYESAWAASVHVQGATVTVPTESLQVLLDWWFAFNSEANVIAPPYLEVDGFFSRCA